MPAMEAGCRGAARARGRTLSSFRSAPPRRTAPRPMPLAIARNARANRSARRDRPLDVIRRNTGGNHRRLRAAWPVDPDHWHQRRRSRGRHCRRDPPDSDGSRSPARNTGRAVAACRSRSTTRSSAPDMAYRRRRRREAIELCARTEALFLDPTYTAKAMAGLIAPRPRRDGAPGAGPLLAYGWPGGTFSHDFTDVSRRGANRHRIEVPRRIQRHADHGRCRAVPGVEGAAPAQLGGLSGSGRRASRRSC